jgi:hypothetical protein
MKQRNDAQYVELVHKRDTIQMMTAEALVAICVLTYLYTMAF